MVVAIMASTVEQAGLISPEPSIGGIVAGI
jgi:hypothetical protein